MKINHLTIAAALGRQYVRGAHGRGLPHGLDAHEGGCYESVPFETDHNGAGRACGWRRWCVAVPFGAQRGGVRVAFPLVV